VKKKKKKLTRKGREERGKLVGSQAPPFASSKRNQKDNQGETKGRLKARVRKQDF